MCTTGGGFFAECLRHSAKADIYSAKPLPSVTLDKGRSVNSLLAKTSLPSALYRALNKGFAECQSDTRQRKVAATAALPSVKVKHSAKVPALPSAVDLDTRQRWPLCRVSPTRHSAKWRPLPSVCDEDMAPSDTNNDYKVRSFLHLHSGFVECQGQALGKCPRFAERH